MILYLLVTEEEIANKLCEINKPCEITRNHFTFKTDVKDEILKILSPYVWEPKCVDIEKTVGNTGCIVSIHLDGLKYDEEKTNSDKADKTDKENLATKHDTGTVKRIRSWLLRWKNIFK